MSDFPPAGVIRIVLADDHPLVRDGLRTILNLQMDMAVVGECGDGLCAVEMVLREQPDVVLLDLRMPRMDGASAAIAILKQRPEARILLLTAYDGEEEIQRAMQAGAIGHLWKDSPKAELLLAIRQAAVGRRHVPSASSRSRPN